MTSIKTIIVGAAVSTILSLGAAQAAEQTMKPIHGVSFHDVNKHAVAYFLSQSGTCKLVVTSADDAGHAPARFEAAIEAGKSKRYQLAGKSREFGCKAEAKAMSVKSLEAVAGN
jgi:hypothetical protein